MRLTCIESKNRWRKKKILKLGTLYMSKKESHQRSLRHPTAEYLTSMKSVDPGILILVASAHLITFYQSSIKVTKYLS